MRFFEIPSRLKSGDSPLALQQSSLYNFRGSRKHIPGGIPDGRAAARFFIRGYFYGPFAHPFLQSSFLFISLKTFCEVPMRLILIYSGLLILGMTFSQIANLEALRDLLTFLTMVCLSYIMLEVGLEFTLDKKRLKSYGWDYVVAATAAAFPWLFCAAYFLIFFEMPWKDALLLGRFAAPTSAGVLFAMLAAAGLGTTWLFQKTRILAIFDDLDTILLLIPLQFLFVGLKMELLAVIFLIFALLYAAYRWLHTLAWPTHQVGLLFYAILIVLVCKGLEHFLHIHLEVLLPAFVFGCILYHPEDPKEAKKHLHEHQFLEPNPGLALALDRLLKGGFMFLVGCSLPKISISNLSITTVLIHVIALTVLSNLGKCFPSFCYRKEASPKERIALSIAMFPRGEVGAAVLFVALGYGLQGLPVTLAGMSLALNLVLTGFFISAVIALISPDKSLKR